LWWQKGPPSGPSIRHRHLKVIKLLLTPISVNWQGETGISPDTPGLIQFYTYAQG
jgi:hypothetical protein